MQSVNHDNTRRRPRKPRILRFLLYFFASILLLVALISFALTLPAVQQRITREAESFLQKKFGTRVEIGAIRVLFPYRVSLEKFLLEDQQGDTLARIGSLVVELDMFRLLDKTIELQTIRLEDAGVYLHSKDSLNNFDFIVQSFASDTLDKKPVSSDTTASPWKIKLDLAQIELRQVNFLMQDDDAQSTTQARIGSSEMRIASADIGQLNFELKQFQLYDSDIRLIQTKKSKPSGKPDPAFTLILNQGDIQRSQIAFVTTELSVKANLDKTKIDRLKVQSARDLLSIQANDVAVENSQFAYRDPEAKPTPGHFNAGDLDLSAVYATLPDFYFQQDSLIVLADALSGKDKSGLVLHALRAETRVTAGSIALKNASASLNQTQVDGDVLLFKNKAATFDRMQIQLRNAQGPLGDLLIFLPPQENSPLSKLQDMRYQVSGNLNGWLDQLYTDNIRLNAGNGTIAYFSGSVQNLTEVEKLGMDLNISRLETNRADLVRWMSLGSTPADSLLLQPLPAYLNATGFVKGSMASLSLALKGNVGALQTGTEFPVPEGPALSYDISGMLTKANNPDQLGMDLQLHQIDAPQNFFASMARPGLEFPDLIKSTGTLRGSLSHLQTDLKINAIRGEASSQLNLKGMLHHVRQPDSLGFDVDFNGFAARQEILGYVPDSMITRYIRLPNLVEIEGQAKGTVKLASGKLVLGLGKLGQIRTSGTLKDSTYRLEVQVQDLRVDQLAADTSLRQIKSLGMSAKIDGEGFQFGESARIHLDGKFDSIIWNNLVLRDITFDADAKGKQFVGTIVSPDERAAVRIRAAGDFTSAIPVLETDIALNCVDLRAFGWTYRPTTICLRIKSRSEGISLDTLTAHVSIESIDLQYDTVHIQPHDLTLDLRFDNRHNRLSVMSDWLQGEIKGYFAFDALPNIIANISDKYFVVDRSNTLPPVGSDSVSMQFYLLQPEVLTTGLIPGLTELDPIYLQGTLIAQRNYFDLSINAPNIVYRDWDVDSLNIRAYAGDSAAMFVLTTPQVKRGPEDFIENARLDGQFLSNIAQVNFRASSDAGQERFLLGLKANINGKTKETLVTLSPQQIIDFKTWDVDPGNQIRITPAAVDIKDFIMRGNGQSIAVSGGTKQLAGNKTGLDLSVDIDRLNYNNFDIFIAGVVRELEGWTEAHLKIKGTTDKPQLTGRLELHETFFTLVATNVRYKLSETPLEFTASGISLDGLSLRDPYDRTLEIKGRVNTQDFANIRADIQLHADRWQVLNSTKQQNPVYYGELYVSLDGTIRGPVSQPDIKLVVRTEKESSFTYVYDVATQSLQHEGIVYFLAPPRQYVRPPVYDAPVHMQPFTLSASIEIDSNLTINSVINPVTGDDFRGKANGRLQLDMLANGTMTLAGRVELVRGVYNYSYQSVVKRSFDVATGSTITWTGNITKPELDLKARYQFKASPYPLVVNQLSTASAEEAAAYRRPQVFFLQTTLKGAATSPDVNFEFIYPSTQRSESLSTGFGTQQSGLVESALSNVNQDKNLLSRQVFGVLLLRNFIGENLGPATTSSGGNPLQTGLSNFLTGQINALADQYLSWIDVDFATTEGSTNTGASTAEGTTNYQLRLEKSFFEDRLTFKLSGGTTVANSNGSGAQSALENASVEYALTPRGELKVTVFSERGFELLNASSSNLRNSGAGFIISKEFGGKK